MSFADYTALKTAIATDWMHRADLSTATGDFISLFESDFNSEMRVRQMEQETTIASTTGYLVHPTSWLSWKEVRGTSGGVPYELETAADEVAVARTAGDGGPSRMFKVKGTKTYLYPSTGGNFATTYYEGVALTGGTNWLLTRYPGAYLYGSLLQAVAFVGDDPRVGLWKAAYDGILDRIKADSRKGEWGRQLRMGHDTPIV